MCVKCYYSKILLNHCNLKNNLNYIWVFFNHIWYLEHYRVGLATKTVRNYQYELHSNKCSVKTDLVTIARFYNGVLLVACTRYVDVLHIIFYCSDCNVISRNLSL